MNRYFLVATFFLITSNAVALPTTCISASGLPCVANSGDILADGFVVPNSGNDLEAAVEAAIEIATGLELDLFLYGKSDDNPELFSFSNFDQGTSLEQSTSGLWNVLAGIPIQYISVKAANSFIVYAAGSNTGTYSTFGILNNGGKQPTVSHISFWATNPIPVPEPGTILLLSLGALGAALMKR